MISLSINQARRLVLVSQGIHRERDVGRGGGGLVNAIEQLGYIQIDTISVVERAHHHTLWNRVKGYNAELLEVALERRQVFEYWSHAAAYLPTRDYRFSLPRKQGFLNGDTHWYEKDAKQMRHVLERIRAEGALQAKDFDQQRNVSDHAWGGHKPAKMALEQLFMQGELMVSRRHNFQKVFDLTERVLPAGVDQTIPSIEEHCDYLIVTFLRANGLGTAAEISYLRKGMKPLVQARCLELVESQQLVELTVNNKHYLALAEFEALLTKKLSRKNVKILSPFDNVLIQRQRMRDLFDFDYQIECYVPADKRQYGYFVLPILGGQKFIGRLDAKIDRKNRRMVIEKVFLETKSYAEYLPNLRRSLQDFLHFNQGLELEVKDVVIEMESNRRELAKQLSI